MSEKSARNSAVVIGSYDSHGQQVAFPRGF